jgi:hypothetical protein
MHILLNESEMPAEATRWLLFGVARFVQFKKINYSRTPVGVTSRDSSGPKAGQSRQLQTEAHVSYVRTVRTNFAAKRLDSLVAVSNRNRSSLQRRKTSHAIFQEIKLVVM